MGMGASNVLDRVSAALGLLNEVEPRFEPCLDVKNGGVLFALPALLVSGLLHRTEKYFALPKGYYGLKSIFLLLALMALARLKSIESLRYCAPGEWGKLLGLDRIPEVRTLRSKVAHFCSEGDPKQWSAELCSTWMESTSSESHGALYIDGHVRVYHGHQTKLPRHYVPRQKLCLRATTDYWVNAMDGQPFFKVDKAVDPGLIKVLEEEIVPRLEKEIPNQPTEQELKADPYLHRFTLIFDREGYSPAFLQSMKGKRIACITYHKFPKDQWRLSQFTPQQVRLASGDVVEMELAERGVLLSSKIWLREVRKLTERGHQVSILSTDYRSDLAPIATAMAETAMAHLLREKMSREDDVRSLLRAIYSAEADILPDEQQQTLTVTLHQLANNYSASAMRSLCHELNATEVLFPSTELRLIYKLIS